MLLMPHSLFKSKSTAPLPVSGKKSWLTVGLKLLLGVTLASNSCIAALLYINHGATQRVESMMTEVLGIRDSIDANLRGSIVQLQQQFALLPRLFSHNPTEVILQEVEGTFTIEKRIQLNGREQYGSFYQRTEKRDMAQGKFVVSILDNQLLLSHGLLNEEGQFTNNVEQLFIASTALESDRQRLADLIIEAEAKNGTTQFYEGKTAELRSLVADKNMEAEQSRTQILGFVDQINLQEKRMRQAMERQQYQSLYAGLAAVFINLFFLFILTRIIVERPLARLAGIVEALGNGQFPDIPWRFRRDQIGVLCGALDRFRTTLLRLQEEEQHKEQDRQQIERLVINMTTTIQGLDAQATEMVQMALSLKDLAEKTEATSTEVARLADDSVRRTIDVGDSSQQINAAVEAIYRELEVQSGEVKQFVDEIGRVRHEMEELSRSVGEIDTIVGTVRTITDQTKILALNATIEAVKAGEFGRGFAVVADEVKKLSQDTALATSDVREKIEAINSTCQSFIASFDTLESGAQTLRHITQAIDQTVQRQRGLTSTIVALSTATGEDSREVSTRTAEVNAAAVGVLRHSRTTNRCAEEIALQLSDLLSGSVRSLEALTGKEATPGEKNSDVLPVPS